MATYTASNGAIVADLTALIATPSTSLPSSGFVVLFVASENNWYEYNPALTSGDATPINNPTNGRWIRIGRDQLTANRTYYVRTDGNDSNNGLTNTSGGAFLTIQKAVSVVNSLDLSIYSPTIKLADGTYNLSSNITLNGALDKRITIQGNTTTPSNVLIVGTANWTTNEGLLNIKSGEYLIEGVKIQSSTFGSGCALIGCAAGAKAFFNLVDFGTTAGTHLWSLYGGFIEATGNYAISGNAQRHFWANANGFIRCQSRTITLTGTPVFSVFSTADYQGLLVANGCTFSGSATGTRYLADAYGQIVAAGGASYFPGNVAGSVSNGGQYI